MPVIVKASKVTIYTKLYEAEKCMCLGSSDDSKLSDPHEKNGSAIK